MPNKHIFCNTPWYEIQIYWDGSFGICCQEDHRLYVNGDYNIARMSIRDWFNSAPVQQFRLAALGNHQVSACRRCYVEEQSGGNSRRIKSNQKSAIFTQAFDHSLAQSNVSKYFTQSGLTTSNPIDIHVDLGNHCNLACKMCHAKASSRIASQEVKWGIKDSEQYIGTDWTRDAVVWENFLQQLLDLPGLNNIHFMGGETLLTPRFEQLVDHMIANQRFDLCFSFVTNGTVLRPELMQKLSRFRRVGIEVSIETVDNHNAYQRQGTDTAQVLLNLERYRSWCDGNGITLTVRPAVSALTIGYFPGLLQYCLEHNIIVKSLLVNKPRFLDAVILPDSVKMLYKEKYTQLINQLHTVDVPLDFNASDPNHCRIIVKQQALMCVELLSTPAPKNSDELLRDMVTHCRKWDNVYGYDAKEMYPELNEVWHAYQY